MPLKTASQNDGTVEIAWTLPERPSSVWSTLASPDALPQWLGRVREGRLVQGERLVIDHGEGAASVSRVLELDPQSRLRLTWLMDDEPESELTVGLAPAGDRTDLTLRHHGLGTAGADYLPGWATHLTYFEAVMLGEPLPPSTFWPLHATFLGLWAHANGAPAA